MDFNTTMIFTAIWAVGSIIALILAIIVDKLTKVIKILKKKDDNEKPA